MEITNSLVAVIVLAALVVSAVGTMTTLNVLDQVTTPGGDVTGYIAGLVNVTVNESAVIGWVIDEVNFTLNTRESGLTPIENETSDNDPWPFIISNDGSTNVNVSISATDLWDSVSNPTGYFEYKCRANTTWCDNASSSEPNSTLNYTSVPSSPAQFIFNFSYYGDGLTNGDRIAVDINVSIPPNEPATGKQSTVTLTATTACTGDANCDDMP